MATAPRAMNRPLVIRLGLLCSTLLAACGPATSTAVEVAERDCMADSAPAGAQVLVFSRTEGYRHASIPAGVAAIRALGERHGFGVRHTEDPGAFRDDRLAPLAAIVFLNTTGDVLDAGQQAAVERFVRAGVGFVGVHSAADTEYDWEWYGRLVGAYFRSHPPVQSASVHVADTAHPSTRCLPPSWARTDEWYDYRARPRSGITVLATLDETTYRGGRMGSFHPVAWYHHFDGGRAWYTGMGHTRESYSEPAFQDHLAGGILWAIAR